MTSKNQIEKINRKIELKKKRLDSYNAGVIFDSIYRWNLIQLSWSFVCYIELHGKSTWSYNVLLYFIQRNEVFVWISYIYFIIIKNWENNKFSIFPRPLFTINWPNDFDFSFNRNNEADSKKS